MKQVALSAQNVGIQFGGLRALSDFSLQVNSGEVLGLIGPNGAGKTTAFNLLTGVYVPDQGQVLVAGKTVNGLRPYQICQHGLARTFQNIRLFKQLSVLDNVKVACSARSHRPLFAGRGALAAAWSNYYDWWRALVRTPGFQREEAEITEQAEALLDVMGLAGRRGEEAHSLPYGEQRRLEIARALGTSPKVLLLDEPAAGMNPREKRELMDLILSLRERFALGVLVIEHDMKLVMGICERITVLDHGETIFVGTAEQVRGNERVIKAYLGEAAVRNHGTPAPGSASPLEPAPAQPGTRGEPS